jgi:hypothetical protein
VDAGAVVALTAAPVDGDIIADSGANCFLVVDNGSGGSINVTILNPNTEYGLDVADRVIAVAAGARKHIPIPAYMRQPLGTLDLGVDVGGKVLVNYSAVTTVTRGVGKLGA